MNSEVVEQDRQMVEEGWTDNGHEQVMETNRVHGGWWMGSDLVEKD